MTSKAKSVFEDSQTPPWFGSLQSCWGSAGSYNAESGTRCELQGWQQALYKHLFMLVISQNEKFFQFQKGERTVALAE